MYPLTLIKCRNGNWLHVGSSPTFATINLNKMRNWFLEKNNLKKLIFEDKLSYEEISRIYGCSSQTIRKMSKKIGIELIPRRKINPKEHFNKGTGGHKCLNPNCDNIIHYNKKQKYCCNKCQNEYRRLKKYKEYLDNQDEFVGKEISYSWLKTIILEEQQHKCAICGNSDMWNNNELHLILDHIDGDATNNRRENLRLICPNCDSQLPTFKARNIGRSTRAYKPYRQAIK